MNFKEIHKRFLNDLYKSSKLDDNVYTILPSILFLISMFILLYIYFHKFTSSFTKWKTKLYRDIIFHWSYYYTTRVWYLFLKLSKFSLNKLDFYVEKYSPRDEVFLNQIMSHVCIFIIVMTVALVPLMILSLRQFYTRSMPNFLMWVAEDPWIRSEIGTSGHYLERPPAVLIYHNKKNTAFRCRRSSSVDNNLGKDERSSILLSRSVHVLPMVRRFD